MNRVKTIMVFGLTFLLLGMFTIITLLNVQENYDIAVLAYADPIYTGQERVVESYIPYSDAELEALLNRIIVDDADNGTLYVITRKTGFPHSLFVPDDYINIWKPSCVEVKNLIRSHKLSFQDYHVEDKVFNLIIDEGIVRGKTHELMKYESELDIITSTYDEVMKCGHRSNSGGGIIINPIY